MKRVKRFLKTLLLLIRGKLLQLLVKMLPKISRESLIKVGYQKKTITVVEEEYVCEIPEPEDPHTKERFSHLIGTHRIPAFFGVILEDVRLIGPYGIPVARSGRIVVEPLAERWLPHVLWVTIKELGFARLLREYFLAIWPLSSKSQAEISFAAHLLCRGSGWELGGVGPVYGHWFGEQIPQLRAIEAIQEETEAQIKLLINRDPASWQVESLEMLGYNPSTLIEHRTPGVRVRKLVVSSLRHVHSSQMELDPKARRWAGERIRNAASLEPRASATQQKKVAYLRTNKLRRVVANIIDVRDVLSDFRFVEDEDREKELKDIISNTKPVENFLVVSGSSALRMMFSDAPREFFEIYPVGFFHRDFCFLLSFELGAKFSSMPGLEVPSIEGKPFFWQGSRDFSGVQDSVYVPTLELREEFGRQVS